MNVVFDFGNVLFEWNPATLIAQHFPGADTWDIDYAAFAKEMAAHPDWYAFDAGQLDAARLAPLVAARMKLDVNAVSTFLERLPHALPPIDATIDIVKRLCADRSSAHRVFYLSNMPAEYADILEKKYPWIGDFHDGIFSGRVGLIKPDPAIFREAERRLNLIPGETLFMDDVAAIIAAARECGWHAEQIHSPQCVLDALAKHGVIV
jgi:putative hydrolase of the HAD superfamily